MCTRIARHAINCLPDEKMEYFSDGKAYRNLVHVVYGVKTKFCLSPGKQNTYTKQDGKTLEAMHHAMNYLPVDGMDYFLAVNVCLISVYLIYGAEQGCCFLHIKLDDI